MARYRVSLSLALVCFWLCHASLALPCHNLKDPGAYTRFLTRHVRRDTPQNRDVNVWRDYLNNHNIIGPTLSFLNPNDEARVRAVCSVRGITEDTDNLCISSQTFSFTTVRSQVLNYQIVQVNSIITETKHIILGCDRVGNVCRPVHFQINWNSKTPTPGAGSCTDRQSI